MLRGYDSWKTDSPDPGSVEDEPCEDCGAGPLDACTAECNCRHCAKSRLRQKAAAYGWPDDDMVEAMQLKGML